ncbi:substrate-binding domain-containing protein, partial [Oligoflexus sp.]|uniref:substrate-binding domain-containing protein n=1 Tax=Oligoflexus sp. TaxID=1971216 RepID=UPI002D76CD6B
MPLSKLTIEAYSMRSVEILQAVARGEIDFGLCFSPLVHPQIEIRKLGTEPLGLCLRSSHPLLKRLGNRPFPFKELSKLPYIAAKSFHGIDNCEQHPCLVEKGIVPNSKVIFDSYDAMITCVSKSDAWSIVPRIVCQGAKGLHWFLPDWKASADVCCLWPK